LRRKVASAADSPTKTGQPRQPKTEAPSVEKPKRGPAPWKTIAVAPDDAEQMQAHLRRITESYPRSNFGPLNRTTARDLLAAAKVTTPEATPNDVAAFLASKFRDKRPYPYENGLIEFGGMLVTVHEDFPNWFRSQPQGPKEIRTETENVSAEAENRSTDSTQPYGAATATVQVPQTITENRSAAGQSWITPELLEFARQQLHNSWCTDKHGTVDLTLCPPPNAEITRQILEQFHTAEQVRPVARHTQGRGPVQDSDKRLWLLPGTH
jgi:hypothetical protein